MYGCEEGVLKKEAERRGNTETRGGVQATDISLCGPKLFPISAFVSPFSFSKLTLLRTCAISNVPVVSMLAAMMGMPV